MNERWRKPARVLRVEDDPVTLVAFRDGQAPRTDTRVVLDEESTERVRLGYLCLNCLEPQEFSFPEHCSLCGYEMQRRQRDEFERQFKGTERVGPAKSLIEAAEQMAEREEEERKRSRRSGIWTPEDDVPKTKGGIVLPKGVDRA